MFHPIAWQRMAETVQDIKLILLLRNPVDRAYSHYRHNVRSPFITEPLSFEKAITAEPERLAGESTRLVNDAKYNSYNHRHFSYLSRGVYIDQLRQLREFFPFNQVFLTSSERFFAHTSEVFKEILQFLNLQEWEPMSYQTYYAGKSSGSLKPETRDRLEDYFEPHNAQLYEYLQMDLEWECHG